jgi:oligopeptide/dipeptide ABC transporter ATP-binding protein
MELRGRDLRELEPGERNRLLGGSLATVFQNPMSAMNPAVRVGLQLAEVSQVHQGMVRGPAMARAVDRLAAVGIGAPEQRARQYPGEFSGGMRQRAMIAMSLMAEPQLIIADEPTTALDANVQREILALLRDAARERRAAVLFISHDIAVVSKIASRVLVMYAGQVVEELPVGLLAGKGAHPYTRALVASIPDMTTDRALPLATIDGRPPEPGAWPTGCAFAGRCPLADARCRTHQPPLAVVGEGRRVACWKPQTGATDAGHRPGIGEELDGGEELGIGEELDGGVKSDRGVESGTGRIGGER